MSILFDRADDRIRFEKGKRIVERRRQLPRYDADTAIMLNRRILNAFSPV